jgi:hypothetical protein
MRISGESSQFGSNFVAPHEGNDSAACDQVPQAPYPCNRRCAAQSLKLRQQDHNRKP